VSEDEGPGNADIDKIPTLKPAFKKDGTVTAASSSSISDGAASLILMRESEAKSRGVDVLATIAGHSGFAHEPEWFTTAPVFAIKSLHEKLGWDPDSVDLYEINEAFACVSAIRSAHPVGESSLRCCTLCARMVARKVLPLCASVAARLSQSASKYKQRRNSKINRRIKCNSLQQKPS
jgi:hypothetical protein